MELLEPIADVVQAAMEEAAQRAEGLMRELLDVDYPPSSKPGEMPHRRTGYLMDSCDHLVVREGPLVISIYITNSAEYAGFLVDGAGDLGGPRDFATPVAAATAAELPELIAARIAAANLKL